MKENEAIILLMKAAHFAAMKHTDQRRKGERGEPYFNHLSDVAQILAEHTGGTDPILVAGGLLHDTIEDTDTTYDELAAEFGAEIANLVREVTDDKSLPKAERKRLQIENAPKKSDRAKMLKIADKTSNLKSILHSPPADWTEERKQEYFAWAAQVVEGCRGVNKSLEKVFDDAH
ncbi:MAG: HD domain-containing protein [Rhodospirillales bacterium]|nr:HD domain-containing protein [Rhodospirillales bacterium]